MAIPSWTEQATLEDGLTKYASLSNALHYATIAVALNDKTAPDVALRVRWMNMKDNNKRRKNDHNLSRKSKGKKERVSDPAAKSSQFSARPNVPPYAPAPAPPMITMDNDDDIPYAAIGGPTAELLEQNKQALSQISANLSSHKIQENINLLCQIRDNFIRIMNDLDDSPEEMKKMAPLTLKMNEEVANSILPLPPHQPQ
ncbi:histone H2A deubiquitinase [Trifolium repens]|nr:histone H2A deubiquitinase [Trifolium repens]